jgi:uncharacterized protein (DUF1810 family)
MPDHGSMSDLQRFRLAQDPVYEAVLGELRRGRKTGHWMWFVFPQLAGLGHSEMSRRYAIGSLAEARAYLADAILGARLRECVATVLALPDVTAQQVFGDIDALKLRSCMTLFHRAAPEEPLFPALLERWFAGLPDPVTERMLG